MLRKYVVLILAIALFISCASAETGTIEAGDTLTADLDNGAFISVPGLFTFTNFSITSGQLQFWLNNSILQWRTNTNKTLTYIKFTAAEDNFTFNGNGTDGYLNFSGIMNNASSNYSFYKNGSFQSYVNSTSDKIVTVNYTGAWSDNTFTIIPSPEISLPKPNITSWSNSNTTNDTLSLSVQRNTNITFNATSNQTMDTWTWTGATQINGSSSDQSYAFKNFTAAGVQAVSVYATNTNGTTQTITWTITVAGAEGLTLSGYVFNNLGVPLQNSRIDLNGNYNFTDANGYYVFTDITEGNYTVLARAISYLNSSTTKSLTTDDTLNFTLSEYRLGSVSAPGLSGLTTIFIFITLTTIGIYRKKRCIKK